MISSGQAEPQEVLARPEESLAGEGLESSPDAGLTAAVLSASARMASK